MSDTNEQTYEHIRELLKLEIGNLSNKIDGAVKLMEGFRTDYDKRLSDHDQFRREMIDFRARVMTWGAIGGLVYGLALALIKFL